MNKPITPRRITRWILLLQEFDITIVDKPRKDNVVAYFLSRLNTNGENLSIKDNFTDEHIFAISTLTPWYADIANYLVVGKFPYHLSPRAQQRIIQKSSHYSWIEGCLFYTRLDQHIWHCVREDEVHDLLKAAHDEPYGGHFVDNRIATKYSTWDTIGPLYSRMPRDMCRDVIVASEWVNLLILMRCNSRPII